MSYHQNGQQYYSSSSAQAPAQAAATRYTDPSAHRMPSVDNGEERRYRVDGSGNGDYDYRHSRGNRSSISSRAHDELFMAEAIPPMSPSRVSNPGSLSYQNQPQSPTSYNPQHYVAPVQIPNPAAFGGVNMAAFPNTTPQPYNPAAYAESNISRHNTVSHPYGFSPTAPSTASSISSPISAAFPSPTLPQHQIPPGGTYSVNDGRQHTQYGGTASTPVHSAYSPPRLPLQMPSASSTSPTAPWGDMLGNRPSSGPYSSVPIGNGVNEDVTQRALPSPPIRHHQSHRYAGNWYAPAIDDLPSQPPAPPQHGSPQRMNTSGRHPQARPLPGPPPDDSDGENGLVPGTNGVPSQDDLFNAVENAFNTASGAPEPSPRIDMNQLSLDETNSYEQSYDTYSPGQSSDGANGRMSAYFDVTEAYAYDDDSDLEAAAGLAALQQAEAQEQADEARRTSGGSGLFGAHPQDGQQPYEPDGATVADDASDSDVVPVDMGLYGGSYEPHFSYGGGPNQLAAGGNALDNRSQPVSSSGSFRRSEGASDASYDYQMDNIHPFPPFSSSARVDTSGTGGLTDPSTSNGRRLSYDDGDENQFSDVAPGAGEPPDMFYHPGMSTSRPLPPPPAGERHHAYSSPAVATQAGIGAAMSVRSSYPSTPDAYGATTPGGTLVPRSTSLLHHSSTPQMVAPTRSKTDAEQNRIRQSRTSVFYTGESTVNTGERMTLDLPALPTGKRFNPAKLTASDFKKCAEPWAVSSVISWLRNLADGEADLKEHAVLDGLVALFTFKVATMNVADAEALSSHVLQIMYSAGTLVRQEEWLKFGSETATGVLYQLTGSGCYAPRVHNYEGTGRCYSKHCERTVKKLDLHAQPVLQAKDDWITFYKVKKEDLEGVSHKEIERQNILHEIVQGEDNYMSNLDVLRILYRDRLYSAQPPVLPPNKVKSFIRDVFGKVDAVKKANEEWLLPQLKYRQREQGPWVVGFSDIFREWIRKAKQAYIEYAAAFPYASFLIRREADKNMLFRTFLENARTHKMSNKLSWDSFLKAPITRLQHYGLLLNTVLKRSIVDNEEKRTLAIAIEEIKNVTLECDARVAEQGRKVDLRDLQHKLQLRPGMRDVELNLDHLGRELIFKGDLQRMGSTRFTWQETHALLFDHYLVLAKTVMMSRDDGGPKQELYDVSKNPIPMDLLILESVDDDPVVKSTMKGIAAVSPAPTRVGTTLSTDTRLSKTSSNGSPAPGALHHTNTSTSLASVATNSSGKTLVASTALEAKDEKVMYPFRIKHLGKEVYTLYAPSAQNRADWVEKITEAKTKHAAALFAQNAEPFRLRVMSDSAFAYEGGIIGQRSISIKGTPLDRAIDEVEKIFVNTGRPAPICRARVNCATTFNQPFGKSMVAVGTDYGVYISEVDNPRGWSRAIQMPRVTQIAVLEEFCLMLLISDKALIAYHLDAVCPVGGIAPSNDSSRRAPQKLSGTKDVGFFSTGKMKDRTLVFFKKRDGLSSVFKVLEPIYQKSSEKKSRLFRTGRTEFFREYDDFYIPAECYGLNIFHSSLAISTSKGFEVLTLDKKQPWSVPDLKASAVASIASRLVNQDPLGMFRISDTEFLLTYTDCAVYVNKHGDISRSVVMEFVGKAKAAALYGPYIVLFDNDFVEIRNAQNGRLRQVIAGRDVKCLDDAQGGSGASQRSIKVAMQHPYVERCQIVVELLLNEGQKE